MAKGFERGGCSGGDIVCVGKFVKQKEFFYSNLDKYMQSKKNSFEITRGIKLNVRRTV